jgi:hypothetical protein
MLKVQSLGRVGSNAPHSLAIKTNHATLTYVDCGKPTATVTENVMGSMATVSRSGDDKGAGNIYGLPWEAKYAARCELGSDHTRFVTPSLNGCAIFISGTQAKPVVVHANCQSETLLEPLSSQPPKYYAMWSDVYVTVLSQLVAKKLIPDKGMVTLLPKDYMVKGVASAAVFGVLDASKWSFYVTVNKTSGETKRIWPA